MKNRRATAVNLSDSLPRAGLGKRGGFTLLELMLAASLGVLVVVLVLQFLGQAASSMGDSLKQARMERQAQGALAWVSEDLRLRDQSFGLLGRELAGEVEVLWVTRQASPSAAGERVLVRYYTAVSDESHRPQVDLWATRKLYRQSLSTQETAELLAGITSLQELLGRLPASNPLEGEFVAEQLGSLSLRAWQQGEAGDLRELPSLAGGEQWREWDAVDLVEIECWILSLTACRKLSKSRAWADGFLPEQAQRFALKFSP